MVGSLNNMKNTEEEEMFLKKLNKLRKKKKSLAASKSMKPDKSESITEQSSADVCPAVKQAEKLKQLAAQKEALSSKEKTYKKAKRKKDSDNRPVAFHPFSPQEPEAHDSYVYNHSSPTKGPPHHNRFSLYNNFVASSEQEAPAAPEPKKFKSGVRRGSTVHVFASGMNEMFIQKTFACAGNLVHISHNANKNTAFVTFENVACAEEAINQLNEKTVEGITLKVSMARKQPNFDSNAEPPADCSAIAASSSQKGSLKDCRSLVSYDDDMF